MKNYMVFETDPYDPTPWEYGFKGDFDTLEEARKVARRFSDYEIVSTIKKRVVEDQDYKKRIEAPQMESGPAFQAAQERAAYEWSESIQKILNRAQYLNQKLRQTGAEDQAPGMGFHQKPFLDLDDFSGGILPPISSPPDSIPKLPKT